MRLELSLVSQPGYVRDVGEIQAVPREGDFVSHEGVRNLVGYVHGVRWTYAEEGKVVVRVWLQKDPPR